MLFLVLGVLYFVELYNFSIIVNINNKLFIKDSIFIKMKIICLKKNKKILNNIELNFIYKQFVIDLI